MENPGITWSSASAVAPFPEIRLLKLSSGLLIISVQRGLDLAFKKTTTLKTTVKNGKNCVRTRVNDREL